MTAAKRYTVNFTEDRYQDQLAELAKAYQITQGEVIETLLDNMDKSKLEAQFKARRTQKVNGRTSKRALMARLKDLPADQLASIVAQHA